jgi:uncharacterized protein YkwD
MPLSLRQSLAVAVVAGAFLWPVVGDHVRAALTTDSNGCAHSSDLPKESNVQEGRVAVLCLLNHHRAEHGLAPLAEDPRLEAAAQVHAVDMGARDFFAHENPDGVEPDARIRATGFDGAMTGENIAWGTRSASTAAEIVEGWMNSDGHRANILRPEFTRVGTGIAHDPPEEVRGDAPVGVYVNNFGS